MDDADGLELRRISQQLDNLIEYCRLIEQEWEHHTEILEAHNSNYSYVVTHITPLRGCPQLNIAR